MARILLSCHFFQFNGIFLPIIPFKFVVGQEFLHRQGFSVVHPPSRLVLCQIVSGTAHAPALRLVRRRRCLGRRCSCADLQVMRVASATNVSLPEVLRPMRLSHCKFGLFLDAVFAVELVVMFCCFKCFKFKPT